MANLNLSDLGQDCFKDHNIVETKIYSLDLLLKGGLELGSMVQLVGASNVGKSTIGLQVANNVCEQGYNVLYLDSEGSVSQEMMDSMGLMKHYNSSFYLRKESKFDKVEEVLDMFISTGQISFIIIDSLAALINPGFHNLNHKKNTREKAGISVTTNEAHVTSGPLTKFMSKYRSIATDYKICFVLINQYRTSIDNHYNTSTKVYGPKNIRYASDVIIKINACASTGSLKSFDDFTKPITTGKALEFEIDRSNKCAPGLKEPAFLRFGSGIDNLFSYFYKLKEVNVITQLGVYYSLIFGGNEIKEKGAIGFIEALRSIGFNDDNFKKLLGNDGYGGNSTPGIDIEV